MGKHLGIKKYQIFNNIYFYEVETNDAGGCHFYMGLDPDKNQIYLYPTNDFSSPAKTIDLNNPHADLKMPSSLDQDFARMAFGQGWKAIRKNEFPDDISYCA